MNKELNITQEWDKVFPKKQSSQSSKGELPESFWYHISR